MFKGELKPAQIAPANKLCARKKMLLAWPQGTGKTIISLACIEKLYEIGSIQRTLILGPQGMAWQWKEKIEEFTDHDGRLVEAKNKLSRQYDSHKGLYTIVPYSVFRKDHKALLREHFDVIIADEAQEFSSFRSKTFKTIKQFRSPYRWALSGTAISNKLEELYAIFEWVDPYLLPYWTEFEKQHIVRNPITGQIRRYKNLNSLNKYLLSTRLERKTIDELKGLLPELLPYKVYVEKNSEVRESEQYLYSVLDSTSDIDNSSNYSRFDPDISRAFHAARKAVVQAKLDYCERLIYSILEEHEHNKVIVYSAYKEPISELCRRCERNYSASVFTGDQDSTGKQAAIELFRIKNRVLLCSNAGKHGLDIPFANYTIHLDVPFSFSTMDQRSTRTQRASSEFKTVVVIYLLVKDSIDEFYYQVTINKGKLSTATQEGGADTVVMRPISLKAYLNDVRTES